MGFSYCSQYACIANSECVRRIQRVQVFTIVWMSIEAAVSPAAAWMARSPALLAFGGDSAIELISAAAVPWRFRGYEMAERTERRVSRIVWHTSFHS